MTIGSEARVRRALEESGLSVTEALAKARRFAGLSTALPPAVQHPELRAWFVPGRIEVLGKHTDYAGGRSLICAAERGLCVVARSRNDDVVRVIDGRTKSVFQARAGDPPRVSAEDWSIYPSTVVDRVARNFPSASRGMDVVFDSDLPSAAGLSSSSALITAVLLALASVNELDRLERWRAIIPDRLSLASYAAAVENGQDYGGLAGVTGVGTAGGSEDHIAILCSEPGLLRQYSFGPVHAEGRVHLSEDLLFVVGVSGVVARKTGNAKARYNRAARAAARVLELGNQARERQDPTLAAAIADGSDELRRILAGARDPEFSHGELVDRFDQFVEESERLVPAAAAQLRSGDLDGFGRTAARSQDLAERLLRNQVPETIALVRTARQCGAIAASAFGAGFGGSVWALIPRADVDRFLQQWPPAYHGVQPEAASRSRFFATRPGPAAFQLLPTDLLEP